MTKRSGTARRFKDSSSEQAARGAAGTPREDLARVSQASPPTTNSTAQPSPRRGFGILTALTIVLLALFGVVDAEAHLTQYQYGETLSKFIQNSQRVFPPLRLGVVGFLVYLIGHLELGWPM